jgi:hypothetical protein
MPPLHIAHSSRGRLSLCLGYHVLVRIDTDRLLKPRRHEKQEVARTAADVQQTA